MFRMDLKLSSLAMSYLVTEEKVRRLTKEIAGREEDAMVPCESGTRVSSVYYKLRSYENLDDYIEDINSYVREARNEGAQILVFPQLMGMSPITFMPGYRKFERDISALLRDPKNKDSGSFLSLVEATQGFLGEIFFNTFATLARCYRMVIAAGGFYHKEDGRVYNTMYCFSEDGEVIGRQNKLFLSLRERRWGVSAGEDVTIAQSSLGKLALLSSGSAAMYEPFFIANLLGASICLVPTSPLDSESIGLVGRANENRQCIVASGMDSSILGKNLEVREKSLIAVPYPFSLKKDGILRMGDKKVNTAMVNTDKLKDAFDNYSADVNGEFIKKMLNY